MKNEMSEKLKKSLETLLEELKKGVAPYKIKEHAAKLAGNGPIKPKHMEQAKAALEVKDKSEKSKAAKLEEAKPKQDMEKVPVTHITSAKAVSEGHDSHYELTHHFADGSTKNSRVKMSDTDIRLKNPNTTHAIHLKGHEPIHTNEATAHKALKDGHFNLKEHLNMKKSVEDSSELIKALPNGQWVLEKAKGTSSVYNTGTHPMKSRENKPTVPGTQYKYDHKYDYDHNFSAAKDHYKDLGLNLSDDKIHTVLRSQKKD